LLVFFPGSVLSRVPLSFPTRRSSDLEGSLDPVLGKGVRLRVGRGSSRENFDRADKVHVRIFVGVVRRGSELKRWSGDRLRAEGVDRKSTRLNSSHGSISYAVFCLKKK